MKIIIKISNKNLKPKLILEDNDFKYLGYINLLEKENILDLDINIIKYVYIKYKNKKTERIILSNNLEILDFYYNTKRKTYDVSISTNKKFGKIIKEISTDECFNYRKNKIINIYYSNNFKNENVHIIFFFDVQNVFNLRNVGPYTKKNDPYKGWQVEVPIEISGKNFIILGIENADYLRETELSMDTEMKYFRFPNDVKNKGKLDNLGAYLLKRLDEFNKLYDIKDVGICGASMGGLASFYLGLKYSNIFDYIFTFSPATGLYFDEYWINFYKEYKLNSNQKMFYYIGGKDALEKRLSLWNNNLKNNLFNAGFNKNNYYEYIDNSLKHNEIAWRYAFNYAFNLFYNK